MMKKFKSLFLVAAAVLIGFSSCNNDPIDGPVGPDVPGTPEGAQISVRFSFAGPSVRVIGDSQSESAVEVYGGVIILADNNGIIRASRVLTGAITSALPAQIFDEVAAGVNQVHFVGNTTIPAGLIVAGQPLSGVQNHIIALEAQTQILTGPNAVDPYFNRVNVWGTGAVVARGPGADQLNPSTGALIHDAHVQVHPTLARVELFNITGNEQIADFEVKGIFMDTFYETARAGGAVIAPIRQTGCGTDASIPNFQPTGFPGSTFASWMTQTVYDAPVTAGVWGSWTGGPVAAGSPYAGLYRVVPTGGEVWGYNLFANNSTMPRIAIRLENVWVYEEVVFSVLAHDVRNYTFANDVNDDPIWVPNPEFDSNESTTPNVPMMPLSIIVRDGLNPEFMHQHTFTGITQVPGFDLTSDPIRLPHPETRVVPAGAPAEITQVQIADWIAAGRPNADILADLVTNVVARSAQDTNSTLFISINGFFEAGTTTPITSFVPRMVYQLGSYTGAAGPGDGSSWTFGPENTTRIPFRAPIDVHVTVQMMPWQWVPTDPILGT